MPKQNQYWKTTKLYLAAFLFAKGAILVGLDATERRAVFSFLDTLERERLVEEFKTGVPLVDVRIFITALETLRQKRMDALMQIDGDQ